MPHLTEEHRSWIDEAIRRVEADAQRSADTHLHHVPLPAPEGSGAGIELYLKDESVHPTGSLKHRLARSLFLYALCNGWLHPGSTVVEASSGSTAVSEAYFARLVGLPFVAVMTSSTSREKVELIEWYGGSCHFVDEPGQVYELTIVLEPTSNLFAAGHRIRLDISSSNFPRFDLNPNTGEPVGQHTHTIVATNVVYHDAERPSHVTLPIIPR